MLDLAQRRLADLPPGHPPALAVVVDTEEEFDWTRPFSRDATATTAIAAQPLAHERVFDRLGIVPTYVIDWPVATTDHAIAPLRRLMEEGRCEIGTHLHPWVSPPHEEKVSVHNSYTGNLPVALERAKLERLTEAIAANFGRRPVVFKAGRYGLGPGTSAALRDLGYLVDTSVVPHTSFRGDGGPDFTRFDNAPYWFGPAERPMLELPVTTGFCGWLRGAGPVLYPLAASPAGRRMRMGGILARSRALERIRLSPEGCSGADMVRLLRALHGAGQRLFTLTYHSPSLEPGHTPYVRSRDDLEALLGAIDQACRFFRDELGGVFLSSTRMREAMLGHHA